MKTLKRLTASTLALSLTAAAHAATVATNPVVTGDINAGSFTLSEQVGNVSLDTFNNDSNVLTFSFEVADGFIDASTATSAAVQDPSIDLNTTGGFANQGVFNENLTPSFTILNQDNATPFFSSGNQGVVSNATHRIRFFFPVAAVAVMVNRAEVDQTVTVARNGAPDVTYTLAANNTSTNYSFFGYSSDATNITSVTFEQAGAATNLRGFDDVAFSYTTVPEPASLILLASGAALMCSGRRNR